MALMSLILKEEVWSSRQTKSLVWCSRMLTLYNTWLRCDSVPCREIVRADGVEKTSIDKWLLGYAGW